ncbi:MAG: hypothetical protein R3F11_27200 [Verrucomicrobiales bacterium]
MTKKLILSALALIAAAGSAAAGFNVPPGMLRIDQVETAKAAAARQGKGIAFIYSDPGTT